jgi:chromosomal replication initiation ATPase DnaA
MLTAYVESAINAASAIAKVSPMELVSPMRRWPLPMARAIAYEYLWDMGMSTPKIGGVFNRNHSTILADRARLNGLKEYDKEVQRMYRDFTMRVYEDELDRWF